jgi:transcriptional regulator with XRE-family HTH domain
MTTNIRFEDWEAERMRDPEFRAAVERLEPIYQVTRLRIMRGLTQAQLAELVGTKQSSIARLESAKSEPKLSFLRRVVEALGARLELRVIPQEEEVSVVEASRALPIRWQMNFTHKNILGTQYTATHFESWDMKLFSTGFAKGRHS